jgi:hypothetical protein
VWTLPIYQVLLVGVPEIGLAAPQAGLCRTGGAAERVSVPVENGELLATRAHCDQDAREKAQT